MDEYVGVGVEPASAPRLRKTREALLADLLCDLMDPKELVRELRRVEGGEEVVRALPGADTPPGAFMDEAVRVLKQHGWIESGDIFTLLRFARPKRGEDIQEIASLWGGFPFSAASRGGRYVVVELDLDYETLTPADLAALLGRIRRWSGSKALRLLVVERGSIRLILSGEPEWLQALMEYVEDRPVDEETESAVSVRLLRGRDVPRGPALQHTHAMWREFERADLRGMDLQGADLWSAHLQQADLQGAVLRGADLGQSDLRDANLRDAKLQGARLWNANLQRANLQDADLRQAQFPDADLRHSNLRGANLYRANLRHAMLDGADLSDAWLWGAKLEDVIYDEHTKWPEGFDPPPPERALGAKRRA